MVKANRGRDAVLLPPLPLKFREALGDCLKVKPEAEPLAKKTRTPKRAGKRR